MFLWPFSCMKLDRAVFWPEVIGLMFASTGKYSFLVVCTEGIILYVELCDPGAWSGEEELLYMAVEERSHKSDPTLSRGQELLDRE